MNDTTRRHPRTLAEAFPDTRASCAEGWQRPYADRLPMVAGVVGIVFALLIGVLT